MLRFILAALVVSAPAQQFEQIGAQVLQDAKQNPYTTEAERASALKSDTKAAVMEAVKKLLKDPDSAKFRGIKRTGQMAYCGWVNAKNGYGGYTGDVAFFSSSKGTVILDIGGSQAVRDLC